MTKVMTKQEEMRARLVELLCNVNCKGDDRREGGCGFRQNDRCNRIEKLDMCMVECIAEHLLAEGVLAPPVKRGQTVYAAIRMEDPRDGDEGIDEWQVHGVMYREGQWYAIDRNGDESAVGAWDCLLTREEAQKLLDKEETENERNANKID